MHIKNQILKDYSLSASTPITGAKTQTKSQYDWDSSLISARASQLATTLSNSKVYDLAITNHRISCTCCDRIPKELVTRPTIEERLECKPLLSSVLIIE